MADLNDEKKIKDADKTFHIIEDDDDSPVEFRVSALEHFNSQNKLGNPIKITTAKSWIMLLSISLIIVAIIIWGFVGKISTRIAGQGILVTGKGRIYTANTPNLLTGTTAIQKITVQPKEEIHKGDVVAILDNSSLRSKISVKEAHIKQLQSKYNELSQIFKQKTEDYHSNLMRHNKVLNSIVNSEGKHLLYLNKLLNEQKRLFSKGFETKHSVANTMQNFYETKNIIEQARLRIVQNEMGKATFIDQWEERLRNLELRLNTEQHGLKELKAQLKIEERVYSPIDGVVVSVLKTIGDTVKAGEEIISISTKGYGMDALVYITSHDAKNVQIDMDALVSPATVKREEYGSIKGKVVDVSTYPTTADAMMAVLHNQSLVKQFIEEGAPIAVRIRLKNNQNNHSSFAWTSSKGPNQTITPGTLVTTRIAIREQPPISLVIPAFKKLLKVE